MGKDERHSEDRLEYASSRTPRRSLPGPTPQFRRRSWRMFQRLLDPFGPLKPLQRPPR